MKENLVFMTLTALIRNFYVWLVGKIAANNASTKRASIGRATVFSHQPRAHLRSLEVPAGGLRGYLRKLGKMKKQ